MSDLSDTYTCDTCTYVQSIDVLKCEMCETVNPNRTKTIKRDEVNPSKNSTECPKCSYVNQGDFVKVCESCNYSFSNDSDSSKRSHSDEDDEDEDDDYLYLHDDDDDDDDDGYQMSLPQNKDKKRKPIEAVEKPMNDEEIKSYFNQYISVLKDERQQTQTFTEQQLHQIIIQLFQSLQYQNNESEGQLVFRACQICYDKDEPMVTMKSCGHRMICIDDFHHYLSMRIRDEEIQPWIPCPAEICSVPCSAENMINDGRLTHGQLLSFITKYMLKKLARNENFISCVQCKQGGFLQFGDPRKEEVTCSICNVKQTIEKGTDGDLDIEFKQMIQSGQLRECPTCRHLTLKEKGLCNVIECAKCGIWWNWRTREQGHNEKDLKYRARMNGSLWEPGELQYQQALERSNPKEFKALLERNGIKYNPNYVRGGWNDQ